MIIDNGERIIPGITNDFNLVQNHLFRYVFALEFIKGLKYVVDLGCGVGYGTKILSYVAENIIGIDKSELGIKYALDVYGGNNISYMCRNIYEDVKDNSSDGVDAIVSFEFIEHVKVEYFFDFVRKNLKSDGCLVVSSPLSDNNNTTYMSAFHLFEWTWQEFKDIMLSKFENVKFYSQKYDNQIVESDECLGRYGVAVCSGLRMGNNE